MNIAFRVDAAAWIGSGHLMRCLTLAVALTEQGHHCIFICAYLNASLKEKILSQGIECHSLPARADVILNETAKKNNEANHQHALWLGVSQTVDAAETIATINNLAIDFLVVDHYGIDATWHRQLSPYCKKMMVIDDLADRSYYCDLLLDQNFSRTAQDYHHRVNDDAELLMGTDFCLLRPQFLQANLLASKPQVLQQAPQKILLSFGGADQDNFTLKALNTLVNSGYLNANPRAEIAILVGAQYPHGPALNDFINDCQKTMVVYKNIDKVAALMKTCELAIGACGSTVWELCCLGVPALLVATAENQLTVISSLSAAGIVMALDTDDFEVQLGDFLKRKNIIAPLNQLAKNAALCVDGKGVLRVVKKMADMC